MNQAKNIKVGDVVQFPCICFAPLRRGWNGWIFRAAIIRSTLLGEEYRRMRLGKLTSEEKAAAIAMWDELADVVRRHAQARAGSTEQER